MFKPRSIQEFTEHTDSRVTKADRKPFRNLFRGFTILELPTDLIIEEDFQNVYVQIRNHEGWKSGLYIDYVQLVDMDDPQQKEDTSSTQVRDRKSAAEEPVDDEGEEYYPMSFSERMFGRIGIVLGGSGGGGSSSTLPGGARSRAVRRVNPVSGSATGGSSASLSTSSTSTSTRPSRTVVDGEAEELPESWYKLFALLVVYCIYVSWTA
ncbi:hypothetical protein BGZ94_004962 [Podila epigama]|nr:hypothetical protein BGZ94_004962 [Podila epigama]